mmetsp:Transcript_58074/g.92247  ORF Transcript_58074/g.92247 Transcript_58074/m.92247 type:complete len:236 (+) Transcript_58074:40-747(+)
MSVLGKRKRNTVQSQAEECKDSGELSVSSPPKKKLKRLRISNSDKEENDMDMDVDDGKVTESVDIDAGSAKSHGLSTKQMIGAFSMDAVINQKFGKITDNDLNGRWSLIYFYPHDFEATSGATLKYLNRKLSEFKSLSASTQIIAVSTESHYAHYAWLQSESDGLGKDFEIPMASDLSMKVSESFGVLQDGRSKHCCFVVSPTKTVEHFVNFASTLTAQIITDQLLITLKSLQTK